MNQNQHILLVDDNEDDVFFMKRALEAASISNPIFVAEDGQKAVDYLAGIAPFTDRIACPLPGLVFLDLKLPRKRGLDVLAWIRERENLRSVVVIVLTSSQEPSDLRQAYRLGANSYLVKPNANERLDALVRAVKDYWLEFNTFDPVNPG